RGAPPATREYAAFNGTTQPRLLHAGEDGDVRAGRRRAPAVPAPRAAGAAENGSGCPAARPGATSGGGRRSARGRMALRPRRSSGRAGGLAGARGPGLARAGGRGRGGAWARDRGLALFGLRGAGLGRVGTGLGRVGTGRLGLRRLLLRGGDVARVDVAVDAAALVELDPARADLALDEAGRLELEAALGDDGAADAAADDGVLRHDVTLHGAVLADHDGLAGADRALDGALDAERSLGLAVADDAHPGSDDRDDTVTWGLHGLVVLRHRLATRLEVLRSSESTQHHGCPIMTRGSMASPFRRTSKWR